MSLLPHPSAFPFLISRKKIEKARQTRRFSNLFICSYDLIFRWAAGATGTWQYARARVFFHSKSVHAPRFYSVVTMAGCHRHLSIHHSEYCFYMQKTAHTQAFNLFSQKSGHAPDFCTIENLRCVNFRVEKSESKTQRVFERENRCRAFQNGKRTVVFLSSPAHFPPSAENDVWPEV